MNLVRKNVRNLYWLAALQSGTFGLAIIVPFVRANGLNLQQFFMLQVVYSAAMFVLEVPTGYLSDRWGRKGTLVIASVFGVAGMAGYAIGASFAAFLVAELLLAVMVSLNSGTQDALLYDTFLELGEVERFEKTLSRSHVLHVVAEALAGVVGAALAFWLGLRAPMIAEVVCFAAAVWVACLLREPKRHKLQEKEHWKTLWNVSVSTLFKNVPLRTLVLLAGLLSTLTLSLVWFRQPYQEQVGLPLYLFGAAHALMLLTEAATAAVTPWLRKKFDDRWLLMAAAVVLVASYLVLGLFSSLWGLLFLMLGNSVWGLLRPLTSSLVNRMTTSDIRATVLSLQAFVGRALFTVAGPFLGYAADVLSLQQAILLTGVLGGLVLVGVFVAVRHVWNQFPT